MRRVNDAQAKPRTLLAMRPDGSCPFHDADRLCAIQKELGVEAMPWICRVFPRNEEHAGDVLARSGSLACVAVARALVRDPTALEERIDGPIGPALLEFDAPTSGPGFSPRERWAVRRLALAMLVRAGWSWPARLVLLALFAEELARLAPAFDRPELRSLLDRFATALRADEPAGVARSLEAARERAPARLVPVVRALLEAARAPVPGKLAWGAFVAAALDHLGVRECALDDVAQRTVALDRAHFAPLQVTLPHLLPALVGGFLHQLRFPGEAPNAVLPTLANAIIAVAVWRVLFVARLANGVSDPVEAAAEVAWRLGRHLPHARATCAGARGPRARRRARF